MLSERIIAGEWKPGARIPTQLELERLFDAGNPTIQQALRLLKLAGFLVPRGNLGTFVATHPPHLSRYALVFPSSPYLRWSRFWEALRHSAGSMEHRRSQSVREFPVFYDVDEHADSKDFHRLVDALRLPALAGIIYANAPWPLRNTALFSKPYAVPSVAIASDLLGTDPLLPVRYPDLASFYERALDLLTSPAGGSRTRIALVCFAVTPATVDAFLKGVTRRGATSRPSWIQSPMVDNPLSIQHAAQALFHGRGSEQPDALVIADDNLVEHTTAGLAQTRLRLPEDLSIVASCNYPLTPPAAVPLVRLGFDTVALLRECVECIDRQLRKEPVERIRRLTATFENEDVPASWTVG